MDLKFKHFNGTIKAIDEERRAIRFVISSDEIDRDNEIVMVDAIKNALPGFSKNPVCLLNHQHRSESGMPTIAGSWDIETFKAYKHHCEMDLIFAKTELGETCWQLCKEGHMKAVSIGYLTLDGREELHKTNRIFIITKMELIEISLVAVPANRRALAKSILADCGFDDMLDATKKEEPSTLNKLKQEIADHMDTRFKSIEAAIEELKNIVIPGSDDVDLSIPGDDDPDPPDTDDPISQDRLVKAFGEALRNEFPHLKG